MRMTLTGGVLLGISGPERKEKAKLLAGKMEEALRDTGEKVSTPTMRAHIRISRIDESVRPEKVARAIAKKAGAMRMK